MHGLEREAVESLPGFPTACSLPLNEGQEICVDRLRLRDRHAMRKVLVGLEGAVLEQLRRQGPCVGVRDDLIRLAMHHQHRHRDLLQVFREIGL